MFFANSHIHHRYKPMELLGPHQTQTDFHPQRVQEPLDIPGGHPQDPPGGEMAFLCHGLGNPFLRSKGQPYVMMEM